MANEYYTAPTNQIPLNTIRSGDYNTNNTSLVSAFDLLPSPDDLNQNQLGTDASTVNTLYLITVASLPSPITTGFRVRFKALLNSAANAQISVNATTQYNLVNNAGVNILVNDILTNAVVECVFNGIAYQLEHPASTEATLSLTPTINLTLAAMKASTKLEVGDVIKVSDRASGLFDIVTGATANTYNIIQLTGTAFQADLRLDDIIYASQFGLFDGTSDDKLGWAIFLAAGKECRGVPGGTSITSGEILIPASTTLDLLGSTIKADPSLPSTDNIVKIAATNAEIINGEINGNKSNLTNSFTSGATGCGVLVALGGDNARVINMNTHDCPTNGQIAVGATGAIDNVLFDGYISKDNSFGGIGAESQSNGSPLTNIKFLNGETSGNDLGGDIRIQGVTNFLVENHNGHNSDHGGCVIGVGEAKNICIGSIVDSKLGNDNVGLSTLNIDGKVGSGAFIGQLETVEVHLNNVELTGTGSSSGLNIVNSALVTGDQVVTTNHSISLICNTNALIIIDKFRSKDSTSQACDIDSEISLTNAKFEKWGSTSSSVVVRSNSSGTIVSGDFGAVSGETGKDGIAQVGSPTNIKLTINSFTGSGLSKGLIAGAIANTWEINEEGARNMLELEDGILSPSAEVGRSKMYIDVATGDLKIIFGDGVVKTIVTDS